MQPHIPAAAITATGKVIFADDMSNHAGNTAPEIAEACDTLARKALSAAAPHLLAPILSLMADPEHYEIRGPHEGYVSVENLRKAIEGTP